MRKETGSYRQIFKATSVFGGVQIFNILISIIRSKLIAVLLGPAGMGIAGLLTSTTAIIGSLTNFGLGTSAVKNVAVAYGSGDKNRIAIIITALRRWVWITGILGMIVTIATAPLLSQYTFGNRSYSFSFVWISISLFFTQLSSGQMALLQGLRKVQHLAKANFLGSVTGLVLTMPLYYIYGVKGIVPAIILTSVITALYGWYFATKVKIEKTKLSMAATVLEGKDMLSMGFIINISSLFLLVSSYLVRVYVGHNGGVEQVGLYNAGFSIIETYVGLVFTAMGADYYPRLAAAAHNNRESNLIINQQAELALIILAPIISGFIICINWVIILLYSTKFVAVNSMILWAALGMFFKAGSWAIGYVILAKGDSKIFFWNELIATVYHLLLNLLFYRYWGLSGLGISFMVGYALHLLQIYSVAKIKYEFSFNRSYYGIFGLQFLLAGSCLLVMKFLLAPYCYVIGALLILISSIFSCMELNKRLDLKGIINSLRKRYV